jgi:hypothetical protein
MFLTYPLIDQAITLKTPLICNFVHLTDSSSRRIACPVGNSFPLGMRSEYHLLDSQLCSGRQALR